MQHVAFFRNLNQGQRGHLTTAELIAVFAAAGANDAVAFQSNGTVVFDARDAETLAEDVRSALAVRGVFDDQLFTRPLAFIEGLVLENAEQPDVQRRELTLFALALSLDDLGNVGREAARRRCAVTGHGPGWAVVANAVDRQSNGTPTIEAVLGVRATSRGLPTLLRLVDRFGS